MSAYHKIIIGVVALQIINPVFSSEVNHMSVKTLTEKIIEYVDQRLSEVQSSEYNEADFYSPLPGSDAKFIGEVFYTAASFPPPGTTWANGEIMSINSNPALFAIIGNRYGGDGLSTMALPDIPIIRTRNGQSIRAVIVVDGRFPNRN